MDCDVSARLHALLFLILPLKEIYFKRNEIDFRSIFHIIWLPNNILEQPYTKLLYIVGTNTRLVMIII